MSINNRTNNLNIRPSKNINSRGSSLNSNGNIVSNITGGMASGFGFGTGIETARGLSNSIFGSKENNEIYQNINSKQDPCKSLLEIINKCQETNKKQNVGNALSDCNILIEMFSEKCLRK